MAWTWSRRQGAREPGKGGLGKYCRGRGRGRGRGLKKNLVKN